jgi:hypothetical protein
MFVYIVNIDYKTQKRVIITTVPRSDLYEPLRSKMYALVTLQGEGAVTDAKITRVDVLNATEEILVIPTEEPGLFLIDMIFPDTTPSGQYIVVIEAEVTLILPDGSTETFREKYIDYVWI